MENFKLISMWLSGTNDYKSGVEIYNRLGKNFAIKSMISKPETTVRLEFLTKAMQDLLLEVGKQEEPCFDVKQLKEEAKEISIAVAHGYIKASDLPNAPEEVMAVIKKRKNLYAEFCRLHTSLNFNTPKEQRRINCLRILDIREQIKPLWTYTKYYNETLRLPEQQKEQNLEELSIIEANKRYELHYKYLRNFYKDEKKLPECLRRIEECKKLKTILTDKDAFFHERFILPEPTTSGSDV